MTPGGRPLPFLERLGDEALAARARAGDVDAFALLARRHAVALRRTAASVAGDAHADDAVQRALIDLHRALVERREPVEQPAAWLHAVCRRRAVDLVRSSGREQASAELQDVAALAGGDPFEGRERLAAVLAAVRGLPEGQRDALVQVELEGRSYGEAAARLGRSEASVRQLLHRARIRVRAAAAAVVPAPLLRWVVQSAPGAGVDRGVEVAKGVALATIAVTAGVGSVAGVREVVRDRPVAQAATVTTTAAPQAGGALPAAVPVVAAAARPSGAAPSAGQRRAGTGSRARRDGRRGDSVRRLPATAPAAETLRAGEDEPVEDEDPEVDAPEPPEAEDPPDAPEPVEVEEDEPAETPEDVEPEAELPEPAEAPDPEPAPEDPGD